LQRERADKKPLGRTGELIKKYGLKLLKGRGQHLLPDKNILGKVVDALRLQAGDIVIEIGPGLGYLTELILPNVGELIGVEIDERFCEILQERFGEFESFKLVCGDILEFDFSFIGTGKVKVAGNIPYSITTPILLHLLDNRKYIDLAVLMVQFEVAQRLVAEPGCKEYSALTVHLNYWADVEFIARVKKSCFIPQPKVDSAIVRLRFREPAVRAEDEGLFEKIVRASFGKRRKSLKNALVCEETLGLSKAECIKLLEIAGIDPGRRGESLSVNEFVELANTFVKMRGEQDENR